MFACVCRLVFDKVPTSSRGISPLTVQVTEYQPINGSQNEGVQVLSPTAGGRGSGGGGGGRGGKSGSPSLVLVLIRTFGPNFMVSVLFKLVSDVLQFVNPLVLR